MNFIWSIFVAIGTVHIVIFLNELFTLYFFQYILWKIPTHFNSFKTFPQYWWKQCTIILTVSHGAHSPLMGNMTSLTAWSYSVSPTECLLLRLACVRKTCSLCLVCFYIMRLGFKNSVPLPYIFFSIVKNLGLRMYAFFSDPLWIKHIAHLGAHNGYLVITWLEFIPH